MSGSDDGAPLIVLPAPLAHLLDVLDALVGPGMPPVAVIGGTGVNIRLSTSLEAHRATPDIDIVADEREPATVEVLAREHAKRSEHVVVVAGVEVEVIPTYPVTDDDLAGLDDGDRLFLAGHRWALDTATPVRLTARGADGREVRVPVATAAGLVAAKSHAAGYPGAARRANKHGGDLYDLYRLLEVFDATGDLRAALAAAPGGIGAEVANVVRAEVLASPARAMRQMAASSPTALDPRHLVDVFEPLVDALTAPGT